MKESKRKRLARTRAMFNDDALSEKELEKHHKEANRLREIIFTKPSRDRETEKTNWKEIISQAQAEYESQPKPEPVLPEEEVRAFEDKIMRRPKEEENPDVAEDKATEELENVEEEGD